MENENSASNDIEKFENEASHDSNQESEGDINMDIEMLKDALGAVVDEKLPTFREELKSDIKAYVDEKLDSVAKSVEVEEVEVVEAPAETSAIDDAVSEFRKELDEALSVIQEQKDALSDASAKIEHLETAGAVKKSVESDEDMVEEILTDKIEESFWDNLYLPQEMIKILGYKK
jgi:predicted transcriptional regulator